MRTFKNYLMMGLVAVCSVALLAGCRKDPSTNQPEPNKPNVEVDSEIVLGQSSITASLDGGSYLVEYTVNYLGEGENPHAGEKITAEAAEDWVNNFGYSVTGVLQFKVDANTSTEERQCLVTVKYRYAEDVTFVVKQGAKIKKGFKLENVTSTYFDYTVDVIPEDKSTPYIVMSAHPEYVVSSGFETGEDYYEDDYAYFGWLGQFYGQSAVQVMQTRAKVGDQIGVTVSGATAGIPYTFYCYYFDYDSGALLSDVTLFTVTTTKPAHKDVTFNMEHVVDSCMIKADVTANGYEGDYYFDVLNSILVDSYLESFDFLTSVEDVVEYWWSNAIQDMSQELSYDEIIAAYTCVGTNPDGSAKSHYDFELLANHDYYLFAFAMEEHGFCCSKPQVKKITTGDVAMSDNVITPSVSNVTTYTATLNFTTTNDDYYVAGWATADEWASYGSNDAERQEYLLTNVEYELCSGNLKANVIDLEAETDYVVYAFGSRGGKPTTKSIYTATFRTKNSSGGSVSISFKDLGYYDAAALSQYPGYDYFSSQQGKAIFAIEAVFSNEEYGAYFWDVYDWTNREHEVHTDQNLMNHYLWCINEYGSLTVTHTYMPLDFGGAYEFSAVVVDADGVFSDLYRQWIRPTYDGCRNPADYVAWWDAYQESQNEGPELSSLVVDELFREKSNNGKRVSEMTFEKSTVMMTESEVVVRR